MSSISGETITITCPQCRKKFDKRLRELKAKSKFPCPKCGVPFEVKGREFESVAKAFSDLSAKIRKLNR